MSQKTIALIIIVAAIIGSIWYIESKKAPRGNDVEVVNVVPRLEQPQDVGGDDTNSNLTPTPGDANSSTLPATSPLSYQNQNSSSAQKAGKYPLAKEITTPDGFINTDGKPIKIGDYVGKKVILVDFWTYSCINCIRTTPYLESWWEKYKDDGLMVIGIHTPEFDFEKDIENVKQGVLDEGIKFPVVVDNDYSTWFAYNNRNWPHKYLIDIDGYIVYDYIGEGAYVETEKKIQDLLAERKQVLGIQTGGTLISTVSNVRGESTSAQSPETYFGALRNSLGNGSSNRVGSQTFSEPSNINKNVLYLSGKWNVQNEYAESESNESKIIFKYKAKKVFLVASSDQQVGAAVKIDGHGLGNDAGEDTMTVGYSSRVQIKDAKLYRVIEHDGVEEHTLEITAPNGLKAFTFTFG